MKVSVLTAAVLASVSVAADPATNHAENAESVSLPAVVIEASRLGKTANEIPAHVEVISRDEIERSGARNTVELLEKKANIFIRKMNANPALAQVSMRGYGANGFGRVKILVDGEELNNPDMEAQDLIRIPVRSVERVEILHGPQTVLHGGDASAGVINIISDADTYEQKTTLEVHGGSWDSIGGHFGTHGGYEPELVTYYADLDWDRSAGWRDNSAFEIWSAKGGVTKHWENGSRFSVKTFYADSQYGLPGGLYSGAGYGDWRDRAREADDRSTHARNAVYGLNLLGSFAVADDQWLDLSFGTRHRKNTGYGEYDIYTYSGSVKYRNENKLFGFGNAFAAGTDLKYDDIDARFASRNAYSRFTGALFAQDEFFIFDELSLVGGVRGEAFSSRDRYRAAAVSATDSDNIGRIAGDIGLNFCPIDDLKLFTRWSRFYHAPLADEMFSAYGVPNMNLAPETGHNTEVGIDWTFLKEWTFAFTAFHTELTDEIMYYNYQNRNAPDDTSRNGFETSFGWSREKTGRAAVLYTFTEARFENGQYKENMIPIVPRQQLRLYGEVYLRDDITVNGGYRFVGRQRYGGDFANNGGMLPDYGIFDLGARYFPEYRWLKGFVFAFTVDNLFDKRYADYGEWFGSHYVYPAAGRCYMFSIQYEF